MCSVPKRARIWDCVENAQKKNSLERTRLASTFIPQASAGVLSSGSVKSSVDGNPSENSLDE
jgi:hypothetical protein